MVFWRITKNEAVIFDGVSTYKRATILRGMTALSENEVNAKYEIWKVSASGVVKENEGK